MLSIEGNDYSELENANFGMWNGIKPSSLLNFDSTWMGKTGKKESDDVGEEDLNIGLMLSSLYIEQWASWYGVSLLMEIGHL